MEKLIISPANDKLLPYFEKILVHALALQNYGDLFLDGLKNKLCAFACRKCIQNVPKSFFFILLFLFVQVEKNAYIT